MHNDIAFVVLTCDKYSDLWPIFIYFFEKNWLSYIIDNEIEKTETQQPKRKRKQF